MAGLMPLQKNVNPHKVRLSFCFNSLIEGVWWLLEQSVLFIQGIMDYPGIETWQLSFFVHL